MWPRHVVVDVADLYWVLCCAILQLGVLEEDVESAQGALSEVAVIKLHQVAVSCSRGDISSTM